MCRRSLPTPVVGHMSGAGFLERRCLCFSYPSGCDLLILGCGRPVGLVFRGVFRKNCCICSYMLVLSMGGGKFRIFLNCHLEMPPLKA